MLERKGTSREPGAVSAQHAFRRYDVLIFGLGRFGTAIGLSLKNKGIRVLGIDFNPITGRRWRDLGVDTEFGDGPSRNSCPDFV